MTLQGMLKLVHAPTPCLLAAALVKQASHKARKQPALHTAMKHSPDIVCVLLHVADLLMHCTCGTGAHSKQHGRSRSASALGTAGDLLGCS